MEEQKVDTKQSKNDFLISTIYSVILNVIIEDIISELSALMRISLLIISILIISGIIKGPKKYSFSRRMKNLITIILVFSIILIIIGAFIVSFSLITTISLVVWMTLMTISIHFVQYLPEINTFKTVLSRVAAVSLGSALVIGGAPAVGLLQGPVNLTIENNCNYNLEYEILNVHIDVPPDGSQKLEVPRVSFLVKRRTNQILIYGACNLKEEISVDDEVDITFNDLPIDPGDTLRINLGESKNHLLVINCDDKNNNKN